jgi:hypothetical protein
VGAAYHATCAPIILKDRLSVSDRLAADFGSVMLALRKAPNVLWLRCLDA